MSYQCPISKGDHILLELVIGTVSQETLNDEHRVGRYSYRKTGFRGLKKCFKERDWRDFTEANSIQGKWDEFLKIYNEERKKYVPTAKEMAKKKNE